jgi:hypothetical protein
VKRNEEERPELLRLRLCEEGDIPFVMLKRLGESMAGQRKRRKMDADIK